MANNKLKNYSYQINLIPESEGGYTVTVPGLSGCVSYGRTIEQATKNAREAIELHLENLVTHRQIIPKESVEKPIFSAFIQVQKPVHA